MFLSVGQSMECLETLQTIKPEVYASTTANKSCCVIDEIRHMIDIITDSYWFFQWFNEWIYECARNWACVTAAVRAPAWLSTTQLIRATPWTFDNLEQSCLTLNLQVPSISARCLEISDLEKASLNRRRATQYSPAKRYEIPRPQHSKVNLRLLPANLQSLAVYKKTLHTGIKWSGHRISAGPNLFMAKPQFSSCQDYPIWHEYDMNETTAPLWLHPHFLCHGGSAFYGGSREWRKFM